MQPAEIGFASVGALSGTDGRLIWELVAKISPAKSILDRYGLTGTDLQNKFKDQMFQAAFREAKGLWNSDMNVQARIKFKAGLLLEDSLEDLILIIKDPKQLTSSKLEATKQLGQLSQTINAKPLADGGGGSQFKLTINMGDNSPKSVTIDGHSLQQPAIEAG